MNNKKYLIIGIVSTLILFIGASVAYFIVGVVGTGKKITVTSKKLEVVFTDSEEITASNIEPGWEYTKTFTVENKTGSIFYYDISIKDLENTFFLPYLEYKITSTNGYNMTEYREVPKNIGTLGRNISINNNQTHTYTIKFRYRNEETIDQSEDMGKTFSGSLQITETPNMIKQILADNPVVLERTDFTTILGTEEPTNDTIYKADGTYTEDGSEVYYFAGNVSNNWVKFGQDENNNDLYWRIIRTNEDGGIRLLYAGTSPDTTEGYIIVDEQSKIKYNFTAHDPLYAGYMYGTSGSLENNRLNTNSSDAKVAIDTWYSRGLNVKTDLSGTTYNKYVSRTAIYCNDRSGEEYSTTDTEEFHYAAFKRLYSLNSPSYRCGMKADKSGLYSDANVADKFTGSTKTGNGQLQYPVALIIADEIVMASTSLLKKGNYYFNRNSNNESIGSRYWWTMTPSFSDDTWDQIMLDVYVDSSGVSESGANSPIDYVRPVLSLKSCVTYNSGNGSSDTPYEVSVDSACALAEN